MTKEEIFKNLVATLVRENAVSDSGYALLLSKGKELGFSKEVVDMLIQMERAECAQGQPDDMSREMSQFASKPVKEYPTAEFKSAISRFGSIIRPDIITIGSKEITYSKRNRFLFNSDSKTMPISSVNTVMVDTHVLGTTIVIRSLNGDVIVGRKFTRADALEIKRLIAERKN